MLIGLFAVAIYSPLVASGRPFVWTEDGVTSYPWFSSLFDRNYFENAVDVFFNLLMVASVPLGIGWKWDWRISNERLCQTSAST